MKIVKALLALVILACVVGGEASSQAVPVSFDGFVFTGYYQLNFYDYDKPHPGLAVGQTITGPGVPSGAVVTFVGSYYVTMSQKATLATGGKYVFSP